MPIFSGLGVESEFLEADAAEAAQEEFETFVVFLEIVLAEISNARVAADNRSMTVGASAVSISVGKARGRRGTR